MDKPKIAAKQPAVLKLEPGKYAYCSCGGSANQPFCDGSHGGTAFRPQMFEMAEARTVAVCQCKRTGGAPFCDGSHKDLG